MERSCGGINEGGSPRRAATRKTENGKTGHVFFLLFSSGGFAGNRDAPSVAIISTPSFEATMDGNPRPAPSSTPVFPVHPRSPPHASPTAALTSFDRPGSVWRESHSASTNAPSHSATPVFPRPYPPQLSSTRDRSFEVPSKRCGVADASAIEQKAPVGDAGASRAPFPPFPPVPRGAARASAGKQ